MSRVQLETQRYRRWASIWGLAGGVAALLAGIFYLGNSSQTEKLALAGAHALAFGFVGDIWLASLLRYLSAQPSRASVPPRLLTFIFVVWNATVVASAITLLAHGSVRERVTQPIPLAGTLAAAGLAVLVVPVVVRRLSGIPPTAWLHLGALAALLIGLGLGDLAYLVDDFELERASLMLVLGGWLPLAGGALFFAAYDYESYEDKRWPLLCAIAMGVAALARFAFAFGVLNENGVSLFASLAGFAVAIALATVLRMRWHGGLSYWYERLAFAGVVALAVGLFLGLERPFGAAIGPGLREILPAPSFYSSILLWAAAAAVMLDQRDLPARTARLVMWPLVVGGLAPAVINRLSSRISADGLRVLLSLGIIACGIGVVTLSLHLLRRRRLRAVR